MSVTIYGTSGKMTIDRITPNFRELYDWLKENRPDVLEWCKEQARWQQTPIGAIITWKEEQIRELMKKSSKVGGEDD